MTPQQPASVTAGQQFSISAVADAVIAAIPDREFVVHGDTRRTFRDVAHRANRLSEYLTSCGLGCHTERSGLSNHESGQDLLGIYAYNGSEYVEGLLGAFHARVAPFNVNYRYVKDELHYLLHDAGATALLYHARFAPRVAEILPELPALRVLIQIADESQNALLPGAVDYESIVSAGSPERSETQPTPDDLYVLYTGGTTGKPKGVLWRQHDIYVSALGGRDFATGEAMGSYQQIVERVTAMPPMKMLVLPPLMHGAAQWAVLGALSTGQTIVIPRTVDRLDPDEVVDLIEREQVLVVQAVGDAMARPVLAAAKQRGVPLASVAVWANGGAPLTPSVKAQLMEAKPGLMIIDGVGASETGQQMRQTSSGDDSGTPRFTPGPDTRVVAEDFSAVLEPGHDGIGWLAQQGYVPLGYKGDAVKTSATFPTVSGTRHAIPGDRARHGADGSIELLGRDAATINSGGEKIFAEEVESAIASHPAVADVMVAGRPSQRWGQEVVAIVALTEPDGATGEQLINHAAQSIARYKLPKEVVFLPALVRSPAGKPDYQWAREQAINTSRPTQAQP